MTLQGVKQRYGIIGTSPELDRAIDTAMRVAPTDLTVLVHGESGVGKESFSKIIHQLSPRKHNNFIAINCGAIPPGTINSELFGHDKGAFTGAVTDRKGYFETVDGGTIFLDEVGEMPLDTQAFLLRVLEQGEFIRVGSSRPQKTDVRVVAATNVDLMARVRKNKFREDLFYRLNTVPIRVPSLSERRQDIFLLFRKFALDFSERYRTDPVRLDDSGRLVIENYAWPGNVRELRNVAEQLSVMSTEKNVGAEQLYDQIPKLRERHLPAKRHEDASSFGESRSKVCLNIGHRFDAATHADELIADAFRLPSLRAQSLVTGEVARTHGRIHPAQTHRTLHELQLLLEHDRVEAIRQFETQHPAKPVHLAPGEFVLRMSA